MEEAERRKSGVMNADDSDDDSDVESDSDDEDGAAKAMTAAQRQMAEAKDTYLVPVEVEAQIKLLWSQVLAYILYTIHSYTHTLGHSHTHTLYAHTLMHSCTRNHSYRTRLSSTSFGPDH